MRLPRWLRIGHRRYKVEPWGLVDALEHKAVGDINLLRGRIRIVVEERPDDDVIDTVVHEILHGLIADAGLDFEDEDEERLVSRLSPRLCCFLRDNKRFIRQVLEVL